MLTRSTKPRHLFCVVAVITIFAYCPPVLAFDWKDDFDDGLFDDEPACGAEECWKVVCGNPGTLGVADGALVFGETGAGPAPGLQMAQLFMGDVSVRVQARLEFARPVSGFSVFVSGQDPCEAAYIGVLWVTGLVQLYRGQRAGDPSVLTLLGETTLSSFLPEEEHLLQVDRRGDNLELRCWKAASWQAGDEVPEPLLRANDDTLLSGYAGLGCVVRSMEDQTARGVFDFFHVWTPGTGTGHFARGNADGLGGIDITDAIFTLTYLFLGGDEPQCLDATDADDTGIVDVTDAVYLLTYLFLGGPSPQDPFAECGIDPTIDDLSCEGFGACE